MSYTSKIQLDKDLWLCTRYYQAGWISSDGQIALQPSDIQFKRGTKLSRKMGLTEDSESYYIFLRLTPLGIAMFRLLQ